jgi:hypothetical protein
MDKFPQYRLTWWERNWWWVLALMTSVLVIIVLDHPGQGYPTVSEHLYRWMFR